MQVLRDSRIKHKVQTKNGPRIIETRQRKIPRVRGRASESSSTMDEVNQRWQSIIRGSRAGSQTVCPLFNVQRSIVLLFEEIQKVSSK